MSHAHTAVTVVGEVERITFENEQTGFRVVRLGNVGGLEGKSRITVVGTFPAVGQGAKVRVSGRWESDPRHGERLVASSLVVLAPDTLEGVEKYLACGVVPGIGPVFAKRIVKYFGMETLAVLDQASHRLNEVPGLGTARIEKARLGWQEHRAASNVLLALQSSGTSSGLALRIVQQYGERALSIVQNNPYRLAIEVAGVGFQTADVIAKGQGIERDHPERVQAGVLHVMEVQAASGHCSVSRDDLERHTVELLQVDPGHIQAAVDSLWAKELLVVEGQDVFLFRLARAEQTCAARIARLLEAPSHKLVGFDAKLATFEEKRGITLAPGQRQAVQAAATGKLLVITGGPGVGKTTIVQAILAVLEEDHLRVGLAAPTGRAAKRLAESTGHQAVTIHRLLSMNPGTGRFERNAESPLELDLLIVDEASMIDVRLAESLLLATADACRLVLVGDVDQLPSVGPGAFLSDLLESGVVPQQRLDVIFRQGEQSGIVLGSHRILQGEVPDAAQDPDGDFFIIEAKDAKKAQQLVLQLVTKRIPARFGLDPLRDVQVLTPMHRGDAGTRALNQQLQAALNPRDVELQVGELTLREGDKVLQTKNDYNKAVFNGDVGEVVSIDLEAMSAEVRFEDEQGSKVVSYARSDLPQLRLAYATSIHKSQGSEYPAVVIPFLTAHYVMLSRNLLYTAVTRAKVLCVLVADPRALSIALGEVRREARRTALAERLRATQSMSR